MKLGKSLATPDISKLPEGPVKEYLRKLNTILETQHRLIHNDLRNQKFGNWQAGNYANFAANGVLTFNGEARIDWAKHTANSVTVTVGDDGVFLVGDLQTRADGNTYLLLEENATPAMDLKVNFVSVAAFHWVEVIAVYEANQNTHAITLQLYNWDDAAYNTFGSMDNHGNSKVENYSFFVPDDTDYIGTGSDEGKVIVRFVHEMAGIANHELYIDVCSLYQ